MTHMISTQSPPNPSERNRGLMQSIEESGFAIVPQCIAEQTVDQLCDQLGDTRHTQRNLLRVPIVRDLAKLEPVRQLVAAILGKDCFAVRGMLFNKMPASNWKVVWHQDKTIAVRERIEQPNFGPWSMKAGVVHVQPPASVMANMLAVRLHLDDRHEDNGPLRVVPCSHKAGNLSSEEIEARRTHPSVICTVARGGAILMRPLLLHASSSSSKPATRRVVHLEFAADELPSGLEWHGRV